MRQLIKLFEGISEWVGKISSWLILLLIFTLVFEVISRHVFNKPTIWSYDVSYMLGGSAAFLGMAWVLKNKQHIRVDVFYEKLSNRNQAILDLSLAVVLFFPLVILGLMHSFDFALTSFIRGEEIVTGSWRTPIYPLKMIIPISFTLLLLQGVADVIKDVSKLLGREI
ncbi:hypothetical protein BTR23_13105 [Alkalihalophilus pseudofirmus]|nr:hypothetical protein BTR23_13105 [Alkalihalophilus pseudofirmus]